MPITYTFSPSPLLGTAPPQPGPQEQPLTFTSGRSHRKKQHFSLLSSITAGAPLPQDSKKQERGNPGFLVQKLVPGAFVSEQRTCEAILHTYHCQNEEFPRPCPLCSSNSFLTDANGQRASVSGRIPVFESRPWSCEQCSRFFHLGCLGVHAVEDAPAKPWFHAHSCRLMFLKLEDLAEQGELPVAYSAPRHAHRSRWPSLFPWAHQRTHVHNAPPAATPSQPHLHQHADKWARWGHSRGDGSNRSAEGNSSSADSREARAAQSQGQDSSSGYTCSFMTDVDQRTWLAQGPPRGPLPIVYDMLADVFPARALLGFGNPMLEHSSGKYACLCSKDGLPVACATFNVHGDYAAQLHLLMTAPNARRQGHTRAVLAAVEENMRRLGVPQLLTQPRNQALELFTQKLGFDVVHPAAAEVLWRRVPIAFTDSVLLGKDLSQKGGPSAG